MKKAFRILGIIALVAILGFSMAACDDGNGGGGGNTPGGSTQTYSIEGTWKDNGHTITISGNSGYWTQIIYSALPPNAKDAYDKAIIYNGVPYFRNLVKTGDRTWSGEQIVIIGSASVATGKDWAYTTITMSADGRSFTSSTNYGNITFTK
jgi:hypothetical protein